MCIFTIEQLEQSLYLPIMYCLQLSLNCVMGLLVWQDGHVIHAWVSYAMVYCLILVGVYLVSSIDYALQRALQTYLESTKFGLGVLASPFAVEVAHLLALWRSKAPSTETESAMRDLFLNAVRTSRLQSEELVELVMALMHEHNSSHASPVLVRWMAQHWKHYRAFSILDPSIVRILSELSGVSPSELGGAELGTSTLVDETTDASLQAKLLDDAPITMLDKWFETSPANAQDEESSSDVRRPSSTMQSLSVLLMHRRSVA